MTEQAQGLVLQPVMVSGFHLKNRVMTAPLTRRRPIVTEAANVSPQARGLVVLPTSFEINITPTRRAVVEREELQ